MIYLLVTINIILLVVGQTFWKIGVAKLPELSMIELIKGVFSPYIFSGLVLYGVATLIWLYILGKAQFSVVYPLQSFAYALGVVVALFVFKETIPATRWIGVVIIIIGAFFIAKN